MRALSATLLALLALPAAAESFRLRAPAQPLEAVIRADDTLTVEVRYRGKTVARTPALGLEIDGHLRPNSLPRLSGSARRSVNDTIRPVVPEKRAVTQPLTRCCPSVQSSVRAVPPPPQGLSTRGVTSVWML